MYDGVRGIMAGSNFGRGDKHGSADRGLSTVSHQRMARRTRPLRDLSPTGAEPRDSGSRLLGFALRSADCFGAGPGELFVVRNVAGLVPPYEPDANHHGTSAALEYGVRVLHVARIAVFGHADCGGVRAMVEGAPEEAQDFVETWMKIAEPVLGTIPDQATREDILDHCETGVVRLSLANLRTYPWIEEAVGAGRLKLQGFRFDIRTGVLARLEEDRFVPVE